MFIQSGRAQLVFKQVKSDMHRGKILSGGGGGAQSEQKNCER